MPGQKRRATIQDVARLAGVSSATVSRVLNQTVFVNPKTQEKVRNAIESLHYVPSSAAQALAGNKTKTIGLFVHGISEVFFVPLLRGIELSASKAGYNLLIHTTYSQQKNPAYKMLGHHNTDGVLVFSDSLNDEELGHLVSRGVPCVLIYHSPPNGLRIPSINIDNMAGAIQVVDHLIHIHQRRRIVFLRGPSNNHDAVWREKGYRQALEQNDIAYDESLVSDGNFHFQTAADSMQGLIRKGTAFDAVFCADDGSAFGAYAALKDAGIRVPQDVSLAGFDDVYFAAHFSPGLTTVQAPTEEVGKLAVDTLLGRIRDKDIPEHVLLPTRLKIRQSCGCVE